MPPSKVGETVWPPYCNGGGGGPSGAGGRRHGDGRTVVVSNESDVFGQNGSFHGHAGGIGGSGGGGHQSGRHGRSGSMGSPAGGSAVAGPSGAPPGASVAGGPPRTRSNLDRRAAGHVESRRQIDGSTGAEIGAWRAGTEVRGRRSPGVGRDRWRGGFDRHSGPERFLFAERDGRRRRGVHHHPGDEVQRQRRRRWRRLPAIAWSSSRTDRSV